MPGAKLLVAIAVSRPGGGLAELEGAITAAKRMATWAAAQGYDVLQVDDGDGTDVTVDALRDLVAEAIARITDAQELDRLVFYFAGHGASQGAGDQFWILSNWDSRVTEAVNVPALQRMLEFYGPKQVAIIGDACQEYAAQFADLLGSSILDKPDEERRPFELDQYFAVGFAKQAFMVKAAGDQESYCLFTEVLLDALQGEGGDASFEEIDARKCVTSQKLAAFLMSEVPKEASRLGLQMQPQVRPSFYSDRVYWGGAPLQPPGPTPAGADESVLPGAAGVGTDQGGADGGAEVEAGADGADGVEGTTTSPQAGADAVDAVDAPSPEPEEPAGWAHALPPGRVLPRPRMVAPPPRGAADVLHRGASAGKDARKALEERLRKAPVRDHFETRCGVCVNGAGVSALAVAGGRASRLDENPNWFRVDVSGGPLRPDQWADCVITLDDGRLVPVCAVVEFVASVNVLDGSAILIDHRNLDTMGYDIPGLLDLMAQLHARALDPSQIIGAALQMRHGKHASLTLGCIAAQFYDAIRDVDSLRSMAAFYRRNQQAIPLDIVLFGGGSISEVGGRLVASVPAVKSRGARTEAEARQRFSTEGTEGFDNYPIAGRVPWMRQAWSAVATASCTASAAAWQEAATACAPFLGPGDFTVVRPEGRAALLKLVGLKDDQAPATGHAITH